MGPQRSPRMFAEPRLAAGNKGAEGAPQGASARAWTYLGRATLLRGPAPSAGAPPHASEGGAGATRAVASSGRQTNGSPPFELFCAVVPSAPTGGSRRC